MTREYNWRYIVNLACCKQKKKSWKYGFSNKIIKLIIFVPSVDKYTTSITIYLKNSKKMSTCIKKRLHLLCLTLVMQKLKCISHYRALWCWCHYKEQITLGICILHAPLKQFTRTESGFHWVISVQIMFFLCLLWKYRTHSTSPCLLSLPNLMWQLQYIRKFQHCCIVFTQMNSLLGEKWHSVGKGPVFRHKGQLTAVK